MPYKTLFTSQSNSGDLDAESLRIRQDEMRRADLARSEFDRIMAPPFRQSLLTDFTPAEMVQSEVPIPDAEPYSALTLSAPIASISACNAALSLSLAFLASSAIRLTAASSKLSSLIPIPALPFFSPS